MLKSSNYGFQFNGDNSNTLWHSNFMCDNYAGLALTNSAVIGPQGNPQNGCGNVWDPWTCTPWQIGAPWQTYCENSDANFSPLFVVNTQACLPQFNTFNQGGGNPYALGQNIDPTPTNVLAPDCYAFAPYTLPPNWRSAQTNQTTNIEEEAIQNKIELEVFPNPTNGLLNVEFLQKENRYTFTLYDISGKRIVSSTSKNSSNFQLDMHGLDAGIYFLIIDSEKKTWQKKIVKVN